VTASIDFNCPFCGLPARAVTEGQQFVIHKLPQCEEFMRMDPLEYVTAVRKIAQKQLGDLR